MENIVQSPMKRPVPYFRVSSKTDGRRRAESLHSTAKISKDTRPIEATLAARLEVPLETRLSNNYSSVRKASYRSLLKAYISPTEGVLRNGI